MAENEMQVKTLAYGEHELQTVTLWKPKTGKGVEGQKGVWVIFIHGGAWRDPTITAPSFALPTITALSSSSSSTSLPAKITAYASLSYRLSQHPSYPQDPLTTPAESLRNAKHPDHINDVVAGLKLLQETYGFAERYLVVGHSCGATLAMQVLMASTSSSSVIPPIAILGVAGIYDLPALVTNHSSISAYREFVTGAFGEDEDDWKKASPVGYDDGFGKEVRRLVVLASSRGDELIEDAQIEGMVECLRRAGGGVRVVGLKGQLVGGHDELWNKKEPELVGVLERTLKELEGMGLGD